MKLARLSVFAAMVVGSSMAEAAYLDLTRFTSYIDGPTVIVQPNLAVIRVMENVDGSPPTNQALFGFQSVVNLTSFEYSLEGISSAATITGPNVNGGDLINTDGYFSTVTLETPYSGAINFGLLDGSSGGVILVLRNFDGAGPLAGIPAVPEPETYAMLLAGLGLMGTLARSRSRSRSRNANPARLPNAG